MQYNYSFILALFTPLKISWSWSNSTKPKPDLKFG